MHLHMGISFLSLQVFRSLGKFGAKASFVHSFLGQEVGINYKRLNISASNILSNS